MSNQPTIQFSKPLRVNLHRDMTPPKVKIECGDIVVADCIGNPDHAERIAACVNACTGIADPHAAIQVMLELQDALKKCASIISGENMNKNGLIDALESSRSALAKAKEVLP